MTTSGTGLARKLLQGAAAGFSTRDGNQQGGDDKQGGEYLERHRQATPPGLDEQGEQQGGHDRKHSTLLMK